MVLADSLYLSQSDCFLEKSGSSCYSTSISGFLTADPQDSIFRIRNLNPYFMSPVDDISKKVN